MSSGRTSVHHVDMYLPSFLSSLPLLFHPSLLPLAVLRPPVSLEEKSTTRLEKRDFIFSINCLTDVLHVSSDDTKHRLQLISEGAAGGDLSPGGGAGQSQRSAAGEE